MSSIKLQFICQDDIISKAIAWFSHGWFSHVDAIFTDDPEGECLFGARSDFSKGFCKGVCFRPLNYSKFSKQTIFEIECLDQQKQLFWEFLRRQEGKPYDHTAIWGFVEGRYWRQDDSWFCSELIAAALEYAGVISPIYINVSKIAPVPLSMIVSAIGAKSIDIIK